MEIQQFSFAWMTSVNCAAVVAEDGALSNLRMLTSLFSATLLF
jgi:hypothetical protein